MIALAIVSAIVTKIFFKLCECSLYSKSPPVYMFGYFFTFFTALLFIYLILVSLALQDDFQTANFQALNYGVCYIFDHFIFQILDLAI
jgi:hypothetical protein